jgi:hypothetical protein
MQCPVCGQTYDQPVKFCPNCGVPQQQAEQPVQPAQPTPEPAAYNQPAQNVYQPERTAYVRADYDPARDGRYNSPPPPPQSPASGQYAFPAAPAYSASAAQPKPSSTGMIVFSIINILCCGFGISFILGIIALIFSIMANSEINYDEAKKKLSTARILNIIGVILVAIQIIIVIILFIFAIATGREYSYNFNY